ncbi:MAG: lamin tail domain-containing protein, partial [Chloroflexi bacterium]|nr:lamin tail domain-containing protein [Chloroflexota bacterium]
EFRSFHCRRLSELMADEFSPAEMFPPIDAAFTHIRPWAEADPNRWQPDGFQFSDGPDELKTYITNRIQFLEGEIPIFCPDLDVPLTINELLAENSSTLADENGGYDDWIEIYNSSSTLAWDLGGMYLTNDLSDPTRWRIPDDTLVEPGGVLLFWVDGEEGEGPLHANFTLEAGGGQAGLFDRDVFGNAPISVLAYAAQAADLSYGRMPDGGEIWQSFAAPTPGWRNEGRPPFISSTARAPISPGNSDTVGVATLISDDGAVVTATLWVRAFEPGASPPDYQPTPMYDDGAHGDGAAGDNIYGASIPPQPDGAWVEYYVEAQDDAGMVSVDRPGWPQGDYRYIVGWERPPLYVNELMALNTRTLEDEDGDDDDWIELYNAGPVDVDLGGMYFSNNIGLTAQYMIPNGITVPAGGYLVLWADGDGESNHLNFKLSGAGEYVGLFDSAAGYYAPIDAVYYDPQTPDVSWGRFPDPSTGSGQGSEWHAMDIPTPGAANRLQPPQFSQVARVPAWPGAGESVTVTAVVTAGSSIASVTLWYDAGSGFQDVSMTGTDVYIAHIPAQTEGTLVSYYLEAVDSMGQKTLYPAGAPLVAHRYLVGYTPPDVVVNEFLAANEAVNQDEAGEYDDWLELYNSSSVAATLDGMYLTDDLSQPKKWQFPPGTTIAAGGRLLVWCDSDTGQGVLHANFKLDRDGEEIGLFTDDAHGNVPLDMIIFGPQQGDVSYGRQPDGADAWEFLDPPTPGTSNG